MRWGILGVVAVVAVGCQREGEVPAPPAVRVAPVVADGVPIALTIPVPISLPAPVRPDGTAATVVGVDTGVNSAQIRIAAAGDQPAMGAVDMEIRYFPTQIGDRRSLALLREAAAVSASVDALLGEHAGAVSTVEVPGLRITTLDTAKLGASPGNTYVLVAKQRSPFGALLLARTGSLIFDWDELEVEWPLMD